MKYWRMNDAIMSQPFFYNNRIKSTPYFQNKICSRISVYFGTKTSRNNETSKTPKLALLESWIPSFKKRTLKSWWYVGRRETLFIGMISVKNVYSFWKKNFWFYQWKKRKFNSFQPKGAVGKIGNAVQMYRWMNIIL